MPISGADVFTQLSAASEAARRQLDALRDQLAVATRTVADLSERRGQRIQELAEFELPELTEATVEAALGDVRAELAALLKSHQAEQTRLRKRAEELTTSETTNRDIVATSNEELTRSHANRERLERQVSERLAADAEFQTWSQELQIAEQRLARHEARIAELRQSAAEKLPAFEQSELFQYLWSARFDTPDYTRRGWVRGWDRWVARLIDYSTARRSYEFLRNTPGLMEAEIAQRQQAFQDLLQQVKERGEAAAEEIGLSATLRAIVDCQQKLATATQTAETAAAEHRRIVDELALLEQARGAMYQQALQRYVEAIGRAKVEHLAERAARTAAAHDDDLVASLHQLNAELNEAQSKFADLDRQSRAAERLPGGLEYVVEQYRRAGYDGPLSYFDANFDLNDHLGRFRDGKIDQGQFWQAIRQRQKSQPTELEQNATNAALVVGGSVLRAVMQALIVASKGVEQTDVIRRIEREQGRSTYRR